MRIHAASCMFMSMCSNSRLRFIVFSMYRRTSSTSWFPHQLHIATYLDPSVSFFVCPCARVCAVSADA